MGREIEPRRAGLKALLAVGLAVSGTAGAAVGLPACGGSGNGSGSPVEQLGRAGSGGEAGSDSSTGGRTAAGTSDEVFDPAWVLDVRIELPPEDWDELRQQTRSIFDVLGSSCLEQPPPRPFTYFPARVTVDGTVIESTGVRKKGFYGSLSEIKPSLKVKFDEFVADQEYSELDRLTLNNSISDASYVKQCLGYAFFARAGVPAPRCNFATVHVNGEYLGLYVNVESIKKRFLAGHFQDNDGDLWEGALSDFRPGWVDTFQKKTNDENPDRSRLQAVVDAVAIADAGLLERIEALVDVDRFIDFWAAEYLVMHADGYARNTNNFYLYDDPTSGRLHFIPWGIDSIMFEDVALDWEDARPESAVWAEGILSRRLINLASTQDAYFERLRQLLDEEWDEAAIQAEIDRMAELIEPHVVAEELDAFRGGIRGVEAFVDGRRAQIEAALSVPPSYTGPLRDPWCVDQIGQISGTFSTTWGLLDDDDPLSRGTGTLELDLNGEPLSFSAIGTLSGPDEDSEKPAVRWVAVASETEIWVAQVTLDNASDFAVGMSVPIDWTDALGVLVKIDFANLVGGEPQLQVGGMLGDGLIEFEAASASAGSAVSGRLVSATVYEAIF